MSLTKLSLGGIMKLFPARPRVIVSAIHTNLKFYKRETKIIKKETRRTGS
jgi:hypothetical protein